MIDRKEVELLVRANLGSSKQTIASLNKSLSETESAIEKQTAAAKRGETAIDELKASEASLLTIQQQLASKADLVGAFQRLGDQVGKAEERVTRTGKAYGDYAKKLEAADSVTDKQQEKLISLSKAHERAQAALVKQRDLQVQLNQALSDAGISTGNLVDAENKIRTSAAQIGVSLNTVRNSIRTYADDVRNARQAERDFASEQGFQKKIVEAAQLGKSADYVVFWERALERAEAAEQQLKQSNALQKQAADAVAATRGYQTLARAADDLTPRVITLRDSINAIINPTATARSTMGGLESESQKLADTIQSLKGPVKDYSDLMRQIEGVQKAITSQAGLVDKFQRDAAAVRNARAEFAQARNEVNQLATATRQAGADESLGKALTNAQARAQQAGKALRDAVVAARESQQALRSAGVATNDLAGAEDRLKNAAQQTTQSIKTLNQAVEQHGEATRRGKAGLGIFNDEGRTTLSIAQRIRGEVLALAASYTGLQGSINLAKGTLDAFNQRQATKSVLSVGLGTLDRTQVDNEYAYIKAQSDRIGLEYNKAGELFGKFSVAAAKSGRSRQEIRFLFEAFAEGGRVLGLTDEKMQKVFVALEQIFSKGKIQSEELKQQLGDALPGVFEIAQKALKGTFPDLNKALQDGKVDASFMLQIATAYRDLVKDQLPGATKTLAAEQARVNNAVNDFKLAISDAGFAKAWTDALQQITEFLKSPDGAKFAESLSGKFTTFANLLVLVLKNMDTLLSVSAAFIALWAGNKLLNGITQLKELTGATGGGAEALDKLGKGFKLVTALAIGWEIGTIIYDKFAIVRQGAAVLVGFLQASWATIKHSFLAAFETMPVFATNIFNSLVNSIKESAQKLAGVFADLARGLGLDALAKKIETSVKDFTFAGNESVDSVLAKRRVALSAELAQIKEVTAQMIADANGVPSPAKKGNLLGEPTADPKTKPKVLPPNDAEIAKRAHKIEQLTSALEQLDARVDKSQKDLLQPQLDAITKQTDHLRREIEQSAKLIGGDVSRAMLNQLDKVTVELRDQTITKFNNKIEDEQNQLLKKIEAADAVAGRKNKDSLDARLAAVTETYAETFREIAKLRDKLLDNGKSTTEVDMFKTRLDAGVAEIRQLEIKKFANEQFQKQEQAINDVLKEREERLKTVDAKLDAGLISNADAATEKRAIIDEIQIKIENLAIAAREFIAAMNGQIDTTKLDELAAKVELARTSAGRLNKTFELTGKTVNEMIASGLTGAFDKMGAAIGQAIVGTKSWGQAFRETGRAFLQFAADFLREIALMIIKALILRAIQSAFPGLGTAVATVANAAVQHGGGTVRGGSSSRTRAVPLTVFANAPRYHSGGVSGLAPNEQATILEQGEEVLSKGDPRNILNGGAAAGGQGSAAGKGTRFVLVDDRKKIPEAMASAEGEIVIMQTLRRNAATVKSIVGRG